MEIKVVQNIFSANDKIAARNRELLDKEGVTAINVMSSPGAGKTSLLLQVARRMNGRGNMGVIEGDIASSVDADRIGGEGVPVLQINTGGSCHLDANMISNALDGFSLKEIDVLFIENVGNLVCPAEFSLGEHKKVMLLSMPEGDDKPHKYPLMFSKVDAVLVNKIDLAPMLDFDMDAFCGIVRGLNSDVSIFPISCWTGEGIDEWISWLLGWSGA